MRSAAGRPAAPLVHEVEREFGLRLALRYFRPPLPANVETERGRPSKLSANGINGRIIHAAGPWRSSGDWWSNLAWSREDWDVSLTDGALYRLSTTGSSFSVVHGFTDLAYGTLGDFLESEGAVFGTSISLNSGPLGAPPVQVFHG